MGFAENAVLTLENNKRIKRKRNFLLKEIKEPLPYNKEALFNEEKYASKDTMKVWNNKANVNVLLFKAKRRNLIMNAVSLFATFLLFLVLIQYLDLDFLRFIFDNS